MRIARRVVRALGHKMVQASEWGLPADRLDLSGDRDVEWAWVAGSLPDLPDGDIAAMKLLREHMAGADARMIFTIPVGRDRVATPYHRIYGHERLPRILDGYRVAKEAFYAKTERNNAWRPAPRDAALAIEGSERFYALGLFVLAPP